MSILFCDRAGRLACAGYSGTQYGVVAFDTSAPSMPSEMLGVDARTNGWSYGFSVTQFAVLGDLFVMLAQPNLGVQRHAELFVSKVRVSVHFCEYRWKMQSLSALVFF